MVKKYVRLLFPGLFFTLIFSGNDILWDFGVVIQGQKVQSNPPGITYDNSIKHQNSGVKINAVISDPFIPPVKHTLSDPVPPESINTYEYRPIPQVTAENVNWVSAISSKNYLQKKYQSIIIMLSESDLDSLKDEERSNLEYWLADAYYQIGDYSASLQIAESSMKITKSDRLILLSAKIFESQGNLEKAVKYYQMILSNYPESDYILSAKIKSRLLTNH